MSEKEIKEELESILHTLEVCKDESLTIYELKELINKLDKQTKGASNGAEKERT